MTANTPLQPQERRASRDSRQGTEYRIRAPSYLYHAVPCSVPRWSHARAHTSGTSHPLNNCMPESQLRGSTHGLEAPPSRLGYLGRSRAPGVHRPLNMCPSRGWQTLMQAHRAHQHAHRAHQIVHATAAYAFIAVGLASGYAIPAIVPACALTASATATCMLVDMRWSTCYAAALLSP